MPSKRLKLKNWSDDDWRDDCRDERIIRNKLKEISGLLRSKSAFSAMNDPILAVKFGCVLEDIGNYLIDVSEMLVQKHIERYNQSRSQDLSP